MDVRTLVCHKRGFPHRQHHQQDKQHEGVGVFDLLLLSDASVFGTMSIFVLALPPFPSLLCSILDFCSRVNRIWCGIAPLPSEARAYVGTQVTMGNPRRSIGMLRHLSCFDSLWRFNSLHGSGGSSPSTGSPSTCNAARRRPIRSLFI